MSAKSAIITALSLVAIMAADPVETTPAEVPAAWQNQREGTAIPVTIYDDSGWSEYRWNYHTGSYYRSSTAQTDPETTADYSFGWSMYDPAPADYWSW